MIRAQALKIAQGMTRLPIIATSDHDFPAILRMNWPDNGWLTYADFSAHTWEVALAALRAVLDSKIERREK